MVKYVVKVPWSSYMELFYHMRRCCLSANVYYLLITGIPIVLYS